MRLTVTVTESLDIENAQIYYVGHSMGTTTYMAMNSMDPAWGDKVLLSKMYTCIHTCIFVFVYTTNINIGAAHL